MRGKPIGNAQAAWPRGASRLPLAVAVLLGVQLTASLAGAELPASASEASATATGSPAPAPEVPPPTADPVPEVPLDRLFELPSSFELQPAQQRAGVDAAEWRRRFRDARDRVELSRSTLRRSKEELAELAQTSDSWKVAPPVGSAPTNAADAPLSYALRQRIQREEAAVKDAERGLLDLEVEANLAGVPEDWRD